MKSVHKILFPLIVFIFLTSFIQGQKYVSAEGKYSIKFPAEFTEEREEGETQTTVKANCVFNEQTLLATYTLHQTELMDHEEMADVSVDSFGKAINATASSIAEWEVGKHKGLIAHFVIEDNAVKVEYRVLLIDQIQYQIIYLAGSDKYDESVAKNFLNSFMLK